MSANIAVFDTKTNVGHFDQYIRFAIGAGLIAVPLMYDGVDAEYAALTSLIAIPILFTAIVRWCPVYAFMHVQSVKHKYDNGKFYSRNVSTNDSLFRYALGAVLILVTMVFTSIADPWLVMPALIAVPVIYSAITKWDPMYALFEIGTYIAGTKTHKGTADIINLQGGGKNDVLPPRGSSSGAVKAA